MYTSISNMMMFLEVISIYISQGTLFKITYFDLQKLQCILHFIEYKRRMAF